MNHANRRPANNLPPPPQPGLAAALPHFRKVLQPPARAKENTIEHHLMNAFDALGLCPIAQQTTPTGGSSDIYVPERQTVCELKRPGTQLGDAQAEQLHRYVAELAQEQLKLRGPTKHDWWGILTNGAHGIVFRYRPDGTAPEPDPALDWPTVGGTPELVLEALHREDAPFGIVTGNPHAGPGIYNRSFAQFHDRVCTLHAQLRKQWNKTQFQIRVGTKYELWKRQMTRSGLAPRATAERVDMFIRHTLLVAIAHLVNASLDHAPAPSSANTYHGIGNGFTAWLTEDAAGLDLVAALWDTANGYDWQARPQDVLRHLYQDCIPPEQRKLFGEFYTPDWLAEMIVEQTLDEEWCVNAIGKALDAVRKEDPSLLRGIGVLDPTCGSGTFLYHAARRLEAHSEWDRLGLRTTQRGKREMANAIASLVVGIDIHPVAVTMARASVRRALPTAPNMPLLIAEGDSLLTDDTIGDLATNGIHTKTPGGSDLHIPPELTTHPAATQHVNTLVTHADNNRVWPSKSLPPELRTEDVQALFDQLVHICTTERNSVWNWYITALLHPHQTATRRLDRIVGNPPWVVLNTMTDADRQLQMKTMAENLGIASGGRNASSFDICAIFLKRIWQKFGTSDAPVRAAFVTSYALLKSETWEPYREASPELTQITDLQKLREAPFTGAASAVAHLRTSDQRHPASTIPVRSLHNREGERIYRTQTWNEVQQCVEVKSTTTDPYPAKPSAYPATAWNAGARLAPHCLIKLDSTTIQTGTHHTTASTVPSRQPPWKNVPTQLVKIPNEWCTPVITSRTLHPFTSSPPLYFIIPQSNGTLRTHAQAIRNSQWSVLDDIYQKHAGVGANTPKTLIHRIDYNSTTTNILEKASEFRYLVCYNTSGQYLASTIISDMIAEDNLHVYGTSDLKEAQFLTTILNATCLQDAFRHARRSDRHFVNHIWHRIPIPRFDAEKPLHAKIADCFDPARAVAIAQLNPELGPLAQDKVIRKELEKKGGIMGEIDSLVRQLLPDHTTD